MSNQPDAQGKGCGVGGTGPVQPRRAMRDYLLGTNELLAQHPLNEWVTKKTSQRIGALGGISYLSLQNQYLRIGDLAGISVVTTDQPFFRTFCPNTSAICTAFNAAPLRRLSETHQRFKPFSTVLSVRMRLMNVA